MQSVIEWKDMERDWLPEGLEVVFAVFNGNRATSVQFGYCECGGCVTDFRKFRDRSGKLLPFTPTHWAYMPHIETASNPNAEPEEINCGLCDGVLLGDDWKKWDGISRSWFCEACAITTT